MKPRDEPIFFLDRSLGKFVVARALREAGATVEIHDDHFPPDAKDEEWILEVGQRGWIVLTKDRQIRNRTLEVAAVAASGVQLFALTAAGVPASEMAAMLVRSLSKIKRVA